MPILQDIQKYMVSLGFRTNDDQFQTAMRTLDRLEKGSQQVAGKIGKNFAKGSGVVLAAIGSIVIGANAFMKSIAEADLETEKFANRMWMTERNARSLQGALAAMKMDVGDINDIAINPELRDRFFKLRADANKYENAEIDVSMKKIRDFQFEFQRMQLTLSYAGRYIAYYLEQYLAKPMEQIRLKLKSFNDKGPEILAKWGDRIGRFVAVVVRLGTVAVRAVGDFIALLKKLPPEIQAAAAVAIAVGAVIAAPWLGVAAAILGVLLLLDDFYTWKEGGKSLFGDFWAKWDEFAKSDESKKRLEELKGNLDEVAEACRNVWEFLKKVWDLLSMEPEGWLGEILSLGNKLVELQTMLIPRTINAIAKGFKGEDYFSSGNEPYIPMRDRVPVDDKPSKGGGSTKLFPDTALRTPGTMPVAPILPLLPAAPIQIPAMANSPQNQVYNSTTTNRTQKTVTINQDNRVEQNATYNVTGSDAQATARSIGLQNRLNLARARETSGWANGRLPNRDGI